MTTPSKQLIDWAIKAELPWLRFNEQTERLEFIVDNTILADYRGCAAHFILTYIEGWHQKSMGGDVTRSWPLDFGTLFHRMMEFYYRDFKKEGFSISDFAIKIACEQWYEMKMDVHLSHKECQAMGGYPGFAGILIQYATQFKAENERIKILATEVPFGRNKEVPIFKYQFCQDEGCPQAYVPNHICKEPVWCDADIFLSGRLDIIADDGFHILPVDHKTMGRFFGDPLNRFINDDGPTGYIYALNSILPTIVPEELLLKRQCNQIQMNLISKAVPKEGSRFKRLSLYKSSEQLEAYRLRTIQTVNHMISDLELYIRGIGMPRDTSKCSNWYFHECTFMDVHRQASKDAELATLKNGFIQLPIWNTETVAKIED
jgi:PD-(D/E)XK nuclease superfamily